jgi:hypothetical protein
VLAAPLLGTLDRLSLRATVFVTGVDAERPENAPPFAEIVARGHELASHSHLHDPWLHRRSREQLAAELVHAEDAIAEVAGRPPVGFRAPHGAWSPSLLEVLADRGYQYDASAGSGRDLGSARTPAPGTIPLDEQAPRRRPAPAAPYHWRLPSGRRLLEIPVTLVPGLGTPLHLGYLVALGRTSEPLMAAYVHAAMLACRASGTVPSVVLHPLDLLGGDQVPPLASLPGMELPGARKVELVGRALRVLGRRFELVSLETHARALHARHDLPLRAPDFGPTHRPALTPVQV